MQLVQLLWKDAANEPRAESTLQRERREKRETDENEVQNISSRNKCQVYGLQHSLHLHGTISKFIIYDVVYYSDLILDLPWALPHCYIEYARQPWMEKLEERRDDCEKAVVWKRLERLGLG